MKEGAATAFFKKALEHVLLVCFSCHEGIPAVAKLRFLFETVLRRHSKKTHSKLQIMSTGLVVDEMLRARLLPREQITSDACDVVRAVIPQDIDILGTVDYWHE